jgi:hypothetical protein
VAADIVVDSSSFANILGAGDIDVQLALDTIDDFSFIDITDTPASFTAQRVLFETASAVTDSANFTYDSANNILSVGAVQFDTTLVPTHSEGLLSWEDDYKALRMHTEVTDFDVILGQQEVVRVNNQTGVTINKGQVVYVNGAQGQRPTIALADADIEAQADSTIGIVAHDINDSSNGYLVSAGLVRDLDTSTFTTGDKLYLSQTAGAITNVAPVAPAHAVTLGYATVINATTGVIDVRIDTGENLDKLHDVSITSLAQLRVLLIIVLMLLLLLMWMLRFQ